MRNEKLKALVSTALLGAMAAMLMVFEFSMPLLPVFIKIDFSILPVIVAGIRFGFGYGMICAVLKVLIHFMVAGTSTMFIGEAVNILISFLYLAPMCLLMKRHKTLPKALCIAAVFCAVSAAALNWLVTFPLYGRMLNMDASALISVFSDVNPFVNNTFSLICCALVPFNLFKYGLASWLTYMLEKRLRKGEFAYEGND
ncbi:MAG: ECF transporter S component [Erysipelotrichaceae bacterium]|nr:ECF transporter S component [Erysipelotrichaceae bacterium]